MTNTESVRRRAAVPRDSIKRVSLPHRTMQSMLNRITINCINSKNSRDSKHRPSAHNRLVHRSSPRVPPFPTSIAILWRKFIDFTRDHLEKSQVTTLPYFICVGGNYVICARLSFYCHCYCLWDELLLITQIGNKCKSLMFITFKFFVCLWM